MADPFSIATGIIGLAETGTALASFLTDKYRTYRDAPEQILEIAHEVEFCAGLISVFEDGIERRRIGGGGGGGEGGRFERDAGNLVWRTKKIFKEIRDLIPQDTNSLSDNYRARLRYMVDKKKLTEKQQRLRELQQMFMFMETMYRYNADSRPSPSPAPSGSKDPGLSIASGGNAGGISNNILAPSQQGNTFEGLMQSPQQSNGGVSANTVAVQFMATLTLKPVTQPEAAPMSETISVEPRMANPTAAFSSLKEERKKKKHGKRQSRLRLENLRRSPYFRPELLEPEVEVRMGASMPASYESDSPTTYSEVVEYMPQTRSGRVPERLYEEGNDSEEKQQRLRREVCSKDEARHDVNDWFDRWFKDDDDSDSDSTENENNATSTGRQAEYVSSSSPPPSSRSAREKDIGLDPAATPPSQFPWENDFSTQPTTADNNETQPGALQQQPQPEDESDSEDENFTLTAYPPPPEEGKRQQHVEPYFTNSSEMERPLPPPPQPQPRSQPVRPSDGGTSHHLSSPTASTGSHAWSSKSSTQGQGPRKGNKSAQKKNEQEPYLTWRCDACHRAQVNGSKYHCTLCRPERGQGYDLCRECYARLHDEYDDEGDGAGDGGVGEWEHVHPKGCFVEMVAANSV